MNLEAPRLDTYQSSDGRTITRITLRGEEGEWGFHGKWVEGHGNIGDRVIGEYKTEQRDGKWVRLWHGFGGDLGVWRTDA